MFDQMKSKIKGKGIRILFPEGNDIRILEACHKLASEDLLEPVILGDYDKVVELGNTIGIDLSDFEIIDHYTCDRRDYVFDELKKVRAGKNSDEELLSWLDKPNYFGTMLVKMGMVDGLVGGATYSTGETVKPSLQIIKTVEGVKKVSSAFIMVKDDLRYVMGDCAINIAPSSEDLAAIAVGCANMAKVFEIDPRVALLSFSTAGSASGEEVDKVIGAKKILDGMNVDFLYDGEMQFDAAIIESVGKQKFPDSKVAGNANVFVFPSLESGNIGYKIAQRLGGFEAIGPLLIGLNAPVNDLSRGCSVDEVYKISIITAMQTLK